MEAGLIVFVLIWIGTGYAGVKIIQAVTRKRAEPPIPPARVANSEGAEYAYAKSADLAARGARKLGKGAGVAIGLFLLTWPIVIVVWVVSTGGLNFGMGTMGRKLRVRGRDRTPEPARGDNWAGTPLAIALPSIEGDPTTDRDAITSPERDAIGAYWLDAARMEHASVPAFSRLSLQLAALGAPAHLLRATHIAALDEIRHAETCFAIARALTGEAHDAGPIPALALADTARVTFTSVALESLVDGCLAEGVAADIAARGAELAREPAIADALAMIARDEATHADLAWDVLAWCIATGGTDVERAVRAHEIMTGAALEAIASGADLVRAARTNEVIASKDVAASARAEHTNEVVASKVGDVSMPAHNARMNVIASKVGDVTMKARYGIVDAHEIANLTAARRAAVRDRVLAMIEGSLARAA